MRRVLLALPTDRACPDAVAALGAEAAYAARNFDVEVHVGVLDTSEAPQNAAAVRALPPARGVVVHHLGTAAQRAFLRQAVDGLPEAGRLLGLLLPEGVSYGACTNRAFLFAAALGCTSVHRRDSDSRYQYYGGSPVFPVHHELTSLGRRAADVAGDVTRSRLDPAARDRRVALVGGSFVGEMSVDLAELRSADPDVYQDVVGLWIPDDCPPAWRRRLVESSFRGAGGARFDGDHTTLTAVSPMRVDMCNISLSHEVYGRVPLPPARDTIGTDYFLTHLVHDSGLPGVLHNRHIVNHYTGERRTDAGFLAYQLRFVRFLLSTGYLNAVYARTLAAGDALLDGDGFVRAGAVAAYVHESVGLDRSRNAGKLDVIEGSYRKLGGRWTAVADAVAARRGGLLERAAGDMADFGFLIDGWRSLVRAVTPPGD
ncbi:hypothetical protein SRB5_56130 [Streptomyces sp. RB5]|uniref:Uncharacterized protein n=1 Tax=Streptomyces smaragdinus TaxID=2585196 RepID=A0A7K0CPU8_9ACTN|nr:DUF6271 family protein [Streptomyces smaragdinus]MQY15431.1 hypothetical protein [Streptomyces smaragdinus]